MKKISASRQEQSNWLQDCVTMFRDAVLVRRAATGKPTPICIAQIAMEFGIRERRGRQFFYNELFTVSRETWLSMKLAALRSCDADVRLLQARLEARRERKRQYELELRGNNECGSFGGCGCASAHGEHTEAWMQPIGGNSDY